MKARCGELQQKKMNQTVKGQGKKIGRQKNERNRQQKRGIMQL